MDVLPIIESKRGDHVAQYHGSWYRGAHTNFIPSKKELAEGDPIERFVLPGWLPSAPFITKSTPLTAFGSCFAAEIAEYLSQRGYNIFGRNLNLYAHIIRFGEGMVNTFAIRQQFEWALGERDFSEMLWVGPNKEIASLDPAIRAETLEIIKATEVFVITLGLAEIWYDKVNGDVFWRALPTDVFDETRHGFRLSTVAENQDNLSNIVRCIRKLQPSAKVIFTLSPLPLMATFRPVSCLTANSVSKAILRVAVDEFMRANADDANVFYFPSYEIVSEIFPDPRQEDNRHLKDYVIAAITSTFERHY